MKTGIQISSFKPLLTTPEEVATACEKLARMNCRWVQLQWINPDVDPDSIADAMKRNGIVSVGVQDFFTEINEKPGYYTSLNTATGGIWVCVSRIPDAWKTPKTLHNYTNALRSLARHLAPLGQKLCFHPVAADFAGEDGFSPAEALLEQMPELEICADLYHIRKSGRNISQWLKTYAGRVCMVHFKDSITGSDGRETLVPPGQGDSDWCGVAQTCREIGVAYAFAEQERWEGDPFLRLKEGFDWLNGQML